MKKLCLLLLLIVFSGIAATAKDNPLRLKSGSLSTLKNSGGEIECVIDFSRTKANRKPLEQYITEDYKSDMETFRREVEFIHRLGFDGKSIINPRQIEVVNEVFTPSPKAIEKALTIIAAIKEAEKKGSGVIAVNGKMVDRPVVIRAERVIELAKASGVLTDADLQ